MAEWPCCHDPLRFSLASLRFVPPIPNQRPSPFPKGTTRLGQEGLRKSPRHEISMRRMLLLIFWAGLAKNPILTPMPCQCSAGCLCHAKAVPGASAMPRQCHAKALAGGLCHAKALPGAYAMPRHCRVPMPCQGSARGPMPCLGSAGCLCHAKAVSDAYAMPRQCRTPMPCQVSAGFLCHAKAVPHSYAMPRQCRVPMPCQGSVRCLCHAKGVPGGLCHAKAVPRGPMSCQGSAGCLCHAKVVPGHRKTPTNKRKICTYINVPQIHLVWWPK